MAEKNYNPERVCSIKRVVASQRRIINDYLSKKKRIH